MTIGVDCPHGLVLTTDVLYEDWFPITEVKKNPEAYRMLGEPSPIKVRRLAQKGIMSPITKKRVRLEVAVGSAGQLCTSVQACRRYLERMNGMLETP